MTTGRRSTLASRALGISALLSSYSWWGLHRRPLASGLLPGSFPGGFLLLRLGRYDPCPAFLCCGDDSCQTCFADPAFGLRCFRLGWRWRFRLSPDSCPSALLGFFHAPSSGSGEFPALPGGPFRRGGGSGGATVEPGLEFGNFLVYTGLLRFVAFNLFRRERSALATIESPTEEHNSFICWSISSIWSPFPFVTAPSPSLPGPSRLPPRPSSHGPCAENARLWLTRLASWSTLFEFSAYVDRGVALAHASSRRTRPQGGVPARGSKPHNCARNRTGPVGAQSASEIETCTRR